MGNKTWAHIIFRYIGYILSAIANTLIVILMIKYKYFVTQKFVKNLNLLESVLWLMV